MNWPERSANTAMAGNCLAVGVLAHLAFETIVAPTPMQWFAIIGLGPSGIAFLRWDIGTRKGASPCWARCRMRRRCRRRGCC